MATAENTILGLTLPTDPRWANLAAYSLEDILTDHAYCEQKAATQGISIIQRYGDKSGIVETLAPIVTEEWGHFRLVYAELQKRELKLGRQRKDEYVAGLMEKEPKGINPDERLLHRLLICALIEARSCERFRILSEKLEEEALRRFYRRFMESEAGHYRTFIELAENLYDKRLVQSTWRYWLDTEVEVMDSLQPRGDRMH